MENKAQRNQNSGKKSGEANKQRGPPTAPPNTSEKTHGQPEAAVTSTIDLDDISLSLDAGLSPQPLATKAPAQPTATQPPPDKPSSL